MPVPAPGFQSLGDPALGVSPTGTIYFATLARDPNTDEMRIAVYSSTALSPSVTFGNPILLGEIDPDGSADKEFLAVDTTGGAFAGRVYVAWSEFAPFSNDARIAIARSTSIAPLAFAAPIQVAPDDALNQGAMPAVGPNGEVYVVWGRFTFGAGGVTSQDYRIVKSTNGGTTFGNPDPADPASAKVIASAVPTPGDLGSGGNAVRNRGFPRMAVDRTPFGSATRGHVYVVWHADPDGSGADRASIFFSRSADGGQSWSRPRAINTGPAVGIGADSTARDNWMPTIAVSPTTGQITVSFYDRREDAANANIRVYRAVSTDGGNTWFNEPVSTASFAPSTGYDPIINSSYMGDYNDVVAAASGFHLSWGDLRNTCSPPGGATSPCSPVGRGDQDVFYRRIADLSGPDLAIRPWGYVTGVGHEWKSPDIFTVDAAGNEINAAKGVVNRLRARARNVGNAAANGASISFSYVPWFVGVTPAAFKQIGAITESFAAAGDLAGGDLKVVPVAWDLTDLTDTNGGVWPMPLSAFDHFCVKVDISLPGDVNLANNLAQTNFFDVPTLSGGSGPLRFLVGNPFDREVRARLRLANLPKGYRVALDSPTGPFDEPFSLQAGEILAATLVFTATEDFRERPPARDLVAEVTLDVDDQPVGGLSIRLARGSDERRGDDGPLPSQRWSYEAPVDRVFETILAVLPRAEQAGEPCRP